MFYMLLIGNVLICILYKISQKVINLDEILWNLNHINFESNRSDTWSHNVIFNILEQKHIITMLICKIVDAVCVPVGLGPFNNVQFIF